MISHRLHGLVNLHLALTTGVLLLLFGVMVVFDGWLPQPVADGISLLPYLLCIVIGMVLGARFVHQVQGHFQQMSWATAAGTAGRQIALIAGVLFLFMFAFKDRAMSRLLTGSFLAAGWVLLVMLNHSLPGMLTRAFFHHSKRIPTLLIGRERSVVAMKRWLLNKQALGFEPVGFLALDNVDCADCFLPCLGHFRDLRRVLEEYRVLQVMMLDLPRSLVDVNFVLMSCEAQGARLLIYSNLAEQLRHPLVTVEEDGKQFFTLQVEPLENPLNRILKRMLDLAVSVPVVLFVLPPLTVLVWAVQRRQAPGPVMFGQMRTGHNQQPFKMVKFRSMRADNPNEAKQATRGDSRIYPFGRFLRRTSLDEFPQFWNVLKGEMSVVGPRPHMLAHDEEFAAQLRSYRTRFFVKPGITGLAQCNGFRGEITDPSLLQQRIAYDVTYVSSWSIWLDVQLIFKTGWQVFFPPKTAY